MRKVYLIASILLLSRVWLMAQSSPTQQPSSPSSAYPSQSSPAQTSPAQSTSPDTSATSSGTSIEGCLAGSSGNYTLTDTAGKSWQLAGDTSKLTEHVGHQVRITGSEAGGAGDKGGSSASAGAGAGASGSSGQSTYTVQKVKMVSSSCPTSK